MYKPLVILRYPHPLLRAVARPVENVAAVGDLPQRMIATMRAASGVGLAAPQVGESLRLIIADNGNGGVYVLFNPEIIEREDGKTETREEGCLSIPGILAPVRRTAKVVVRGLDENGAPQQVIGEGLLAACLQHEIDHLNGVLFVDYLSAFKRERLLAKYQKMARENASLSGE